MRPLRWLALALMLAALGALGAAPGAQVKAQEIVTTVTAVRVRALQNAVQVRIETDGRVRFGLDRGDWTDDDDGSATSTQSLRVRVAQARSRLPVYVPIDRYPVDGALVGPGTSEMAAPFFSQGAGPDSSPSVDIELRFAVPVRVRRVAVEPNRVIGSGSVLNPLEVDVARSDDGRAIVITIVPDRADIGAAARLDRSPREARSSRLSVQRLADGFDPDGLEQPQWRLEALHVPLSALLDRLGASLGAGEDVRFVARPEVAALPVSLVLPRASLPELVAALEIGYGLGWRVEQNALVLGRGDEFLSFGEIALWHLAPDQARGLMPDFLLPFLRPNREKNSLIVSGTPRLLARVERDLRRLDTPRALFEVRAEAWEIARERGAQARLSAALGGTSPALSFDSSSGFLSLARAESEPGATRIALELLASTGRARLVGSARVSSLAGSSASLFLGQSRFVNVLQRSGNQQVARALRLQIGTSLEVTPRGSGAPGAPIHLRVRPRVSSIDSIERGTGLPTLAIREAEASAVLEPQNALVLAGLDTTFDFDTRARSAGFLRARRSRDQEQRRLLILVQARPVRENASPELNAARGEAFPARASEGARAAQANNAPLDPSQTSNAADAPPHSAGALAEADPASSGVKLEASTFEGSPLEGGPLK